MEPGHVEQFGDLLANVSGNALAIATFIFFIRYFIQKEQNREKSFDEQQTHRDEYFGKLIEQNTTALKELKSAISGVRCHALMLKNGKGEHES